MKLSEYNELMDKLAGINSKQPDPRISGRDLDWREGPGKEGSATITFLDGKAVYLSWYVWDLDQDWMEEQIEKELGSKFRLCNMSGGNGHYGADLELISSDFGGKL